MKLKDRVVLLRLVGTVAGIDPYRNVEDGYDPFYLVMWDVEGAAEGWRESDLCATDK